MASQGWEENSRTTGLGLVTVQPLLLRAKEWSKGYYAGLFFSQSLPIRRRTVGVVTGETELLWLEPPLFYCSGKDNRDPCVLCLVATRSRIFVFSFDGLCIQLQGIKLQTSFCLRHVHFSDNQVISAWFQKCLPPGIVYN